MSVREMRRFLGKGSTYKSSGFTFNIKLVDIKLIDPRSEHRPT